jgi:hypothetical protein
MVKRAMFATCVVVIVTVVAVVGSASGDAGAGTQQTLNLQDVAAPINTFVDVGTPGPSVGDMEVFRDTLVWANDGSPAGKSEGRCTLIELSTHQFECAIVTTLQGGTITTEGIGVLAPGAMSTAAITGGTGVYENASGHATLVFHPGGGPSVVTLDLRGTGSDG